ncbi:hypothetical protein ACQPXB_18850 [Amycolatopsis sp. CA-161197]|uniref:hypothetical protein n=1 Tax=Amycolatopsis sp. CA-161197 TaxID=3239922 RepID=UPI003D8BAA4D
MKVEPVDVDHLGDRVGAWLQCVLEGSPPAVRRAASSISRWGVLEPQGVRVSDLLRGFGRTADFPAAADFLRATVDFSTVLVEDRLSRAGDPNVYPADEVPAMPADPVSVDLEVSVFTVASSGALTGILQGMSHWQFPVLLMVRCAADPATLKHDILQGRVRNVAGVVISCCDGETVLVSR